MTETLDRDLRGRSGVLLPDDLNPRGRQREAHRPLASSVVVQGAVAAVVAAVVAVVIVEAVVLLAWAGEARGAARSAEVLRLGLAAWLLGLHTRVHSGGTLVGFAPLGLTLLCAALVASGAARVARARWEAGTAADRPLAEAARILPAVAVPYGAIAGVVAGAAGGKDINPSPVTALVGGLTVGLLGSCWGVHRARSGLDAGLRLPVPRHLRRSLAAGVLLAGVLVTLGGLLAAASLALHARTATGIATALGPGVVGGGALTVLQVTLVPNAAIWGLAWLTGPGFAVGAGTSVAPTGATLGHLPALPLIAALPRSGSGGPGLVVLLVPVLCAVVVATVLLRRSSWPGWIAAVLTLVRMLVAAVVCVTVLVAASGGPAGGGRLLTLGPSWWHVGLAVAAETAVAGLLVLAGFAVHLRWPEIVLPAWRPDGLWQPVVSHVGRLPRPRLRRDR